MKAIDYFDIETAINHTAATPVLLWLDEKYDLPADRYILGAFAESFRERLRQLNLVWRTDKSDCNTFALEAMAHAKECHLASTGKNSFAFGACIYWTRGGKHAANIYATHGPTGAIVARVWEPQTQRVVPLTEDEWKGVEWIIM